MSSESALPVAIPNVAQGLDVSACSLWPTEEKKALAHYSYLLEVVGFDLQLLFLPLSLPASPKDGTSTVPSAWTCFCASLVPVLS